MRPAVHQLSSLIDISATQPDVLANNVAFNQNF